MNKYLLIWLLPLAAVSSLKSQDMDKNDKINYIPVADIKKTADFEITGDGSSREWEKAVWMELWKVQFGEDQRPVKAKVMYSGKGLYFLAECVDKKLTCPVNEDMGDLYTGDVVEVFIWPNVEEAVYFEYEISPLNNELVLMVPNDNGTFHGWLPWHYEGDRKIIHKTKVSGGKQENGAEVTGWTAEFFIPFVLLTGLGNVPPESGSQWRMNICRIDYDGEETIHWTWSPGTSNKFHSYQRFGIFRFE
ncbi:lipoprotein [sediment metagenome]|uniref:Lipoprotein n=1 Tax=sediment metagenome TaxID=749907 RepID=D9PJE9_9ZZZZ